jgi:hypothetical protein
MAFKGGRRRREGGLKRVMAEFFYVYPGEVLVCFISIFGGL